MWSKSVLRNNKYSVINLRWLHQIQSASYLNHPGSEPLTISTLGDAIAETAHKYPGRIAVKSSHENISVTYEELLTKADSLGCALRSQGLVKGDRLGLWSHNCVAWIVAAVAAARAGLISVLLNPVYEKAEIAFCIRKTGMKGLHIGETLPNRNYYGTLEKLIPELHSSKPGEIRSKEFPELTSIVYAGKDKLEFLVVTFSELSRRQTNMVAFFIEFDPRKYWGGTFGYDSLIKDFKNRNEISKYGAEVKPEEGCLIHLTSGTTGEPKAALDSHIGIVNNSYFIGKRNLLHEEHHNICVQAPLFHALGSIVTTWAGFRHGCTLVLAAPTYNVAANIKSLFQEKCTIITGTPTMYVDMLNQLFSAPPQRLRVALAAGAPCSPQLIKDINTKMNTDYVKALYGLTENTACAFHSLPDDSVEKVAETVGYITDHTEAKVLNKSGEMVPFGVPGELFTRGYNNMIGYWGEPEKTRKTIDKDGWVATGDEFVITEDGYGKVVGRLKGIIVKGGENIAPKEIEDFLNSHPDILDSQVIGVSDARLGEELCAVVRLREGANLTLNDITKFCTGRLARFKIPKILKQMDEFPKTTSGKIQKFKIKELVDAGKV